MVDPELVVAVVTIVVLAITGGIKISIGNINIGNQTKEKNDD